MTGDQRTIQQWTVRIDGIDQKTVKPGDSIEIGRKPLRPLPDDGTERLEIADGTRSMSKRHATFAVSQNGGGTVRDLGSTNGSYVVRGNGDLMRLPPNVDFLLPTSPMRLQFGDVPVDFIRVEQPVSDTFVVPDLFGYALETVKQEPDVADMSVDDILDLRAGEPTAAISAATVRKRVGELNAAASQTFPPQKTTTADGLAADSAAGAAEPDSELAVSSDAAMPVEAAVLAETVSPAEADAAESDAEAKVPEAAESSENAAPADAVDAADAAESTETATSDTASPETVTSETVTSETVTSGTVTSESAADTVPADSAASDSVVTAAQSQTNDEPSEPDSMPLNVAGAKPAVALPRDLFADALAEDSKEAGQSTAPAEQVDQLSNGQPSDDRFQQASSDQEAHDDIRQAVNEVVANAAGVVVTAGAVAGDGVVKADTDTAHGEIPEEHRRFAQPNDDEADSTGSFRPAFEPGSVFELVSKGRLAAAEPKIEVNGYTSDQAKTTEDYTEQFAIANCEELLPFLAMNPLLYDDLYNWLEDQGKADIDAALENNEGYKSYRKAVGK